MVAQPHVEAKPRAVGSQHLSSQPHSAAVQGLVAEDR